MTDDNDTTTSPTYRAPRPTRRQWAPTGTNGSLEPLDFPVFEDAPLPGSHRVDVRGRGSIVVTPRDPNETELPRWFTGGRPR